MGVFSSVFQIFYKFCFPIHYFFLKRHTNYDVRTRIHSVPPQVFAGVVGFGLYYGLVLLPVLLSLVGAQPYLGAPSCGEEEEEGAAQGEAEGKTNGGLCSGGSRFGTTIPMSFSADALKPTTNEGFQYSNNKSSHATPTSHNTTVFHSTTSSPRSMNFYTPMLHHPPATSATDSTPQNATTTTQNSTAVCRNIAPVNPPNASASFSSHIPSRASLSSPSLDSSVYNTANTSPQLSRDLLDKC